MSSKIEKMLYNITHKASNVYSFQGQNENRVHLFWSVHGFLFHTLLWVNDTKNP